MMGISAVGCARRQGHVEEPSPLTQGPGLNAVCIDQRTSLTPAFSGFARPG